MNLSASLEKISRPFALITGIALIAAIGVLDYLTGYDYSFSVFYVLPIALITWIISQRLGLAASLISAVAWLIADMASRPPYTQSLIPVWNTLIRLSFFVIITLLLAALKRALQRESELSRIDYLTGAVNSRFFYTLIQMEMDRFRRYPHPFTLAYIDLDNFKTVNDQFGHAVGDQVLCSVVSSIKNSMRNTDTIARLGGDEFALLLPETNQDAASVAFTKFQNNLVELMRQNKWPITVSIGILTCEANMDSPDELLKIADELMYSVKRNGKNALKFSTYTGKNPEGSTKSSESEGNNAP